MSWSNWNKDILDVSINIGQNNKTDYAVELRHDGSWSVGGHLDKRGFMCVKVQNRVQIESKIGACIGFLLQICF